MSWRRPARVQRRAAASTATRAPRPPVMPEGGRGRENLGGEGGFMPGWLYRDDIRLLARRLRRPLRIDGAVQDPHRADLNVVAPEIDRLPTRDPRCVSACSSARTQAS